MVNIPDAPWIRDAERNGYPLEDYYEDEDFEEYKNDDFCPLLMPWLTDNERR